MPPSNLLTAWQRPVWFRLTHPRNARLTAVGWWNTGVGIARTWGRLRGKGATNLYQGIYAVHIEVVAGLLQTSSHKNSNRLTRLARLLATQATGSVGKMADTHIEQQYMGYGPGGLAEGYAALLATRERPDALRLPGARHPKTPYATSNLQQRDDNERKDWQAQPPLDGTRPTTHPPTASSGQRAGSLWIDTSLWHRLDKVNLFWREGRFCQTSVLKQVLHRALVEIQLLHVVLCERCHSKVVALLDLALCGLEPENEKGGSNDLQRVKWPGSAH